MLFVVKMLSSFCCHEITGTYDYAMGTNVFFSESTQPPEPDPNFRELPDKMFEYFGETNKVLKMKRIFVEERGKSAEDSMDTDLPETLAKLRVTKTYGEALNQFLQPGEEPPRIIQDDVIPVVADPEDNSDDEDGEDDEAAAGTSAMATTASSTTTTADPAVTAVLGAEQVAAMEQIDIENLPVVLASNLGAMGS